MSKRKMRVGRVRVPFADLEKIAAEHIASMALAKASDQSWRLTRHSAFYRRKDGTYTLNLVWHGSEGMTLTGTIRGLELVAV